MTEIPKNVQKWLDALRSGKYRQVKGTLKGLTDDGEVGYCCLGVYEAKVNKKKVDLYVRDENDYLDEGDSYIYEKLRERLGGEVVEEGVSMNDGGSSFAEIADKIEDMYREGNV